MKATKIVPAIPYISIYSGGSVSLDSQHAVGEVVHFPE